MVEESFEKTEIIENRGISTINNNNVYSTQAIETTIIVVSTIQHKPCMNNI